MTRTRRHLRARWRLALASLAALGVALVAPATGVRAIRVLLAFDAAAVVYLALAWHMILTATAEETRRRAAVDDPGHRVVFAIVLGASAAIVFGALGPLFAGRALGERTAELLLSVTVSAAVLAWGLTHTAFALHYARLCYARGDGAPAGLLFPGGEEPDDLDFAYAAFTVGMTFQVSDVQVTSSALRRAVLGQSVLAFAYNTIIVALVLNLVFARLQ